MDMKLKTRDMTVIAVMAALICLAGPMTIPLGLIPLSLATFAIYLSAAVLGAKRGAMATGIYLLLGIAGLPVFSGFSGGIQKLAGPTGGFLAGYLPCAWIAGLGVPAEETGPRAGWRLPLYMVCGTALMYALGTLWFMAQSGNTLAAALGLCVVPFIPTDAIKIVAACLLARPIRRAIYRSQVSA